MKNQAIVHGMEAVGVLMPDGDRFRFIAVMFSVWALDGSLYDTPAAAQIAVRAHFAGARKREAVARDAEPHSFPTAEGYHAFADIFGTFRPS